MIDRGVLMASPELHARTSTMERGQQRRWWAFAAAGLAQLMVTVDITIVNIALPSAQQALGFSDAARQWVVTGYALAFGSLLLISGRLTDLFGRRITMLLGVIIFGAGSALGGAAPDFTFLIIARVFQGVGGALLAPAALATLTALFTTSRERARAFGIFGAIGVVGGALGLLLGGVLTQNLDWRWTLYVNFGIALVALVGVLVFFERDRERTTEPQLDLSGAALVTARVGRTRVRAQ